MSTEALSNARSFLEALHDAEFRGRKDTDGAARYRLATRLGIKENYLFRLQYRAEEMKDVAGEVYRRLRLAYEDMCERNERAADASRAQRLGLRNDYAVNQKPPQEGLGMDAPRD
ncbi:MAG: hypothetical protein EOQ60_32105 [Mesorhizobium sp.]|nr:MAG: hypothetical protein EOQ60_32105 [Mesorhizobium sp.]